MIATNSQLDRVTMTGADDATDPHELARLSEKYPFVEWGLLLSSRGGRPRFPSLNWLGRLYDVLESNRMAISFHICGQWVRDICAGNWSPLFTNVGPILDLGDRVQLNFHTYTHLLGKRFVPSAFERCRAHGWQVIFQCDGVNDHLVSSAYDEGLDAVPLYDKSGGAGIVPNEWPRAMKGIYSGYAGGLGPENLGAELFVIDEAAAGGRYWIDMETRVRTADGRLFDLLAVERCLEIARDCGPRV